jgi:hypothetical protein
MPLKIRRRKEMKEDPNLVANGRLRLVGLWKVSSLVAFGRFQTWWPH